MASMASTASTASTASMASAGRALTSGGARFGGGRGAGVVLSSRPGCLRVRADSLESGAPAPTRVAATVAGSGHRFRACPGAGCAIL
ncbi:hypothetical protein [Micromonospora zamorensis]|uniref:hypothetical protein n=1 Tax=Micromonospora zamorensis TaxID=709883 RepID=UPI00352B8002